MTRTLQSRLSRRHVLEIAAAAAGALMIGAILPPTRGRAANGGASMLTAWVRISPDDTIAMMIPSAEMGQGITTSLPMLVAEELEVDWRKISVQFAPADPAYPHPIFKIQPTGPTPPT